MPEIAVDVVLLPSEEMMDRVIHANKELLRQYPKKIVLDKATCLPHISLAMGYIHQKSVPEIEIVLKNAGREHPIGVLSASGVRVQKNSSGEIVSVLQIENTDSLQSLHEQLMQKLAHFFSYDVRADMVFGDESVSKSTLLWIKNYPEKSSYSNFFPHITLGYGEIKITNLPIEFSVSKLALCHLGNHCTCRKVLAASELTA
jgi:2'-5' RNA ligase